MTASTLDELEATAGSVAETALPATVSIGRDHRGAGAVVAPGRVVTSGHNLRDRTTQVTFSDGRTEQAVLRGVDRDGDLAVLDCDTGDVSPLDFADGEVSVGAIVFGASRGGAGERLTLGSITGADRVFRGPGGRPIEGAIEHSAPLGRGSSGGPLLDRDGKIVGLNTHRQGSRFYLAIPASADLSTRVERLGEGDEPPRRRLGIALAPSRVAARLRRAVGLEPRDGALVRSVEDDSPAARAGLREGDLIVSLGDNQISEPDELVSAVAVHDLDAPLSLTVVRGDDEVTVEVRFGDDGPTEQGTA